VQGAVAIFPLLWLLTRISSIAAKVGSPRCTTAQPASFALRLARKDLGLATAAGYDAGASLPLVATALETFTMALGAHGDEDVALIAAFVDEMSQRPDGLPTVSAPC
jgi:3-hydroxyisobutyrate dehydrogenase-like beta-hydroxyacid dehydrogenase